MTAGDRRSTAVSPGAASATPETLYAIPLRITRRSLQPIIMSMSFSVGVAAKHYSYEVVQFVGLVVVGFWIFYMAAFSIVAAIVDAHTGFSELWANMAYSVLFYATLWIIPALIIVAAHVLFMRPFRRPARKSVNPWVAAAVLLPLAPVSLLWWGYVDHTSVVAMLVLGPLLFIYGWRAATASIPADRSPWHRRVERLGLVLGLGYFVAFAILLASSWVEALL